MSSTEEQPKWGAKLGRIAAWIVGTILLINAAALVLAIPEGRIAGIGFLFAGLLILPPTAAYVREKAQPPVWAPPIAAVVAVVAGFGVQAALTPDPVSIAEAVKPQTNRLAADTDAQRLVDEYAAMDDGARFALQIDDHLMASVEAISTAPPDSMPDVWARLGEIERMAAKVREGRGTKLNDAQRKKLAKFEAALAAKQEQVFPQLRKAYRSLSKSTLWERDIDVKGSGRTIEYIGGLFASNANIKAAQDVVGADLLRLRFDIARYRWIPDGRGAQYSLGAPPDREIVG
ncbi:hypothetical protein J2X45_002068 [Caulobacter sp. BE264]|uniref:hypothetical protein n=1 Tax=Caulobacter sp. BE264 TaxID=2817724 RepID=UPI0028673D8B|nr:hypothetical protein [Caulobacter sp. BE264]MDR7230977.1 hypothetical protein [Caulobacter sp. BE264]